MSSKEFVCKQQGKQQKIRPARKFMNLWSFVTAMWGGFPTSGGIFLFWRQFLPRYKP
jgi:hypothetical protein